jgi:hypothetical protein
VARQPASAATLASPTVAFLRGTGALLLLSALLAGVPFSTIAADATTVVGAYVDVSAEAWSNGLPILDIDGTWRRGYKARKGTQRAYETGRAEAGLWWRWSGISADLPWRVGGLARVDASAITSGQAAEVLAAYQGKRDPDVGSYDARVRGLLWKGTGWTIQLPACMSGSGEWCMTLAWDHMQLQRLRVTRTDGVASYLGDGNYGYQVQVRDDSWKTRAPFVGAPAPSGRGDALSLSWRWRAAPEMQADTPEADSPTMRVLNTLKPVEWRVQIKDVWSSLRWADINTNLAVIDSNTSQRNAQGYIDVQPLIRGQYRQQNLHERIPITTRTDIAWQADAGQWTLMLQHRQGLWQRWLGWRGQGDVRPSVSVEPVMGVLQLGLGWGPMEVSAWTDRSDAAARARGLALRGEWGW